MNSRFEVEDFDAQDPIDREERIGVRGKCKILFLDHYYDMYHYAEKTKRFLNHYGYNYEIGSSVPKEDELSGYEAVLIHYAASVAESALDAIARYRGESPPKVIVISGNRYQLEKDLRASGKKCDDTFGKQDGAHVLVSKLDTLLQIQDRVDLGKSRENNPA